MANSAVNRGAVNPAAAAGAAARASNDARAAVADRAAEREAAAKVHDEGRAARLFGTLLNAGSGLAATLATGGAAGGAGGITSALGSAATQAAGGAAAGGVGSRASALEADPSASAASVLGALNVAPMPAQAPITATQGVGPTPSLDSQVAIAQATTPQAGGIPDPSLARGTLPAPQVLQTPNAGILAGNRLPEPMSGAPSLSPAPAGGHPLEQAAGFLEDPLRTILGGLRLGF